MTRTTRRKRLLVLALPVVLVLLAVGAWATSPEPSAISLENAAQIRAGMTVAQVETFLGGPARDEVPELSHMRRMIQSVRPDLEWCSDQVSVWVHLDADGRVKESRAIPAPPGSRDVLTFLRRWLRL
jgi:hypothetical protein